MTLILFCGGAQKEAHTLIERLRELKSVDELRIEARGDFDTHTTKEEPEVQVPQVRLLKPPDLVLLHHAGDDGVSAMAGVWFLR